jgi:DNA topoisomerase-1
MGIDTEKDFKPSYTVPADKKKTIASLKKNIKKDTKIWIATDEDREGEAIGWHLLKALKIKEDHPVKRIVFHEITKSAILDSLKNPREINQHLVDAQQARRVLDRLVGYELSPLLWKKVRYGLSAGRVQSVAVRLIVDREREIEAFKAEEYWKIAGLFIGDAKEKFEAHLAKIDNKKAEVDNKKSADKIVKDLDGADYQVSNINEKETKRNPAPPFITSTLQQEASRKLGFSVKKTMVIAQQLYEGVKHDKETSGLITYMRTDSFNLSKQAVAQAQDVIEEMYGKEYLCSKPRVYKKTKGAQEAHEAIRPTNLARTPEDMKQFLDRDQSRLYELIWKRTIACQMKEAKLKNLDVEIQPSKQKNDLPYTFKATGQTILFPGFMKVYIEGVDHPEDDEIQTAKGGKHEKLLPPLKEEEDLTCEKIDPTQHFTQPPHRYTEASLVKKLESEGIGRPSTYAPTITTIMTRGYIEKEAKALKPTDTGMVVTDLLVKHFPDIVDYKFTAEMEEDLDIIAEGGKEWVPLIKAFYDPFHKNVVEKEKTLKRSDVVNEESDEVCDKCGKKMVIKLGRYGKFLSCSNYPECKNAKPLDKGGEETKPEIDKELKRKLSGKKCDKCGALMEIRMGRYGEFLGCSNYPKCKNIQPIIKFSGVKCPKCGKGQLIERRTRKGGKVFFGCNQFPRCKFATWDKPLKDKCKKCDGLMVEKGDKAVCIQCTKKKKE